MPITIHTRLGNGIDGVVEHLRRVEDAINPTAEEMAELGEMVRERNLERTAQGVDAEGNEFVPYSTKGPYYFNPAPNATDHERRRAIESFARRHPGKGEVSSERHTIKFESYAAFKEATRGDALVDLTYPIGAEHMLQDMSVWESGVHQVSVGFKLGTRAAQIALEHIRGLAARHLPVRRMLGVGPGDRETVYAKRADQIREKLGQ